VADIGRVSAGDVLAGLWRAWIGGEHHLWLESDDPPELASGKAPDITCPREGVTGRTKACFGI